MRTSNRVMAARQPDKAIKATILLYSGRQNPTLVLDDTAVQRLRKLLAAARPLRGLSRETVALSTLGYNGILIENGAGLAGLPRLIFVFRADLELHNGEARFFHDATRAVEAFLLQLAHDHQAIEARQMEFIRAH